MPGPPHTERRNGMKTSRFISKVRALLNRSRWVQGEEMQLPNPHRGEKTTGYCLIGALDGVLYSTGRAVDLPAREEAEVLIAETIRVIEREERGLKPSSVPPIPNTESVITSYNDEEERKKYEVIAMLDRAEALAIEREFDPGDER